jgi:hypothetical protein
MTCRNTRPAAQFYRRRVCLREVRWSPGGMGSLAGRDRPRQSVIHGLLQIRYQTSCPLETVLFLDVGFHCSTELARPF